MRNQTSPIVAARQRRKLSQAELARRIGVSRASVCGWEKGRATPDPKHAVKLVELLPGLKLDHLYRGAA